MEELAIRLMRSLGEYLEDEMAETEDWEELPPQGSDLLSNLRYLVRSNRCSLQDALELLTLYLTVDGEALSVPEHLCPMMQQVRLLQMDEDRMVAQ